MIEAYTPNLWELKREIGMVKTKAILVMALLWLARLVNVERNLTEVQIGELAADILESHGYLKVEEVKHILKQAVKREKIYGRLDYNIVMGWFDAYADTRAEECRRLSEAEDTRRYSGAYTPPAGAISLSEYLALTRAQAEAGDKEAAQRLAEAIDPTEAVKQVPPVSSREKEDDFKAFRRQYVIDRMKNQSTNNHPPT